MSEQTGPNPTPDPVPRPAGAQSPILHTVAWFAVPLTVYVSVIIFFQGHNKPGGGFIAGVLAAAAGAMTLLAHGTRMPTRFAWWKVAVLVGLTLPVCGATAAGIVLLVGSVFRLAVARATVGQFEWWKVSVIGLIIAVATGTAPFMFGGSFMNQVVLDYHVPLFGHEHLPTATFFDLGVYLIVFGTLMTIFVELGQEGD